MRIVIQRVTMAHVSVEKEDVGSIGPGLLILVGVGRDDAPRDAAILAEKAANLRIFSDEAGKMNRSVKELGLSALVVSQFTLYADCTHGRRPFFGAAAAPEMGESLYLLFCRALENEGIPVQTGRFRSHMEVGLVNDGPVTIILDSKDNI